MISDKMQSEGPHLVPTGIEGLDQVLRGGLSPRGVYLVDGDPGSGKTTLALQFLLHGVRRGEHCMLVTLCEDKEELRAAAESHGWSLEGIHILEILASEESLKPDSRYTMYHPSEVELGETTKAVLAEAARIKPDRLVIDSLSEFRLLAENRLRYRRQILALKRYFAQQDCTVLLVDDQTDEARNMQLYSVPQGVISLARQTPEYGSIRRRVQVVKMRGRTFREGYHDFVIRRGGLQVFPRLVAAEHKLEYAREAIKSGVDQLDALLCGGLAKGTSTLIIGAAGTGKSSLTTQFAYTAAARGEHISVFLFDERIATFVDRAAGFGMDVDAMIGAGRMRLRQVDAGELSPGEFAHVVRAAVEEDKTQMVVIDSLNGYLNAAPSEHFLTLHLHELLSYLGQQGVTTLLLMTQHGMVGSDVDVPVDASYLADAVILLRYFEAFGEVRQAISVIKKRTGKHERTIRELRLEGEITVGEPIRDFQGVLTGSPQFLDKV